MILTPEDARDIVFECHDDWQLINGPDIIGHSRWSVHSEAVFLHKPTNKYYRFDWSKGATEYQYEQPFEYDKEVKPQLVKKETKLVEVTEWVNDG